MQKEVKLKHKDKPVVVKLIHFKTHTDFQACQNNIELKFEDIVSKEKYLYEFKISPGSAFAYLSLDKPEGLVVVYDPYLRNPNPKYIDLLEVGRQLSLELKFKS